MKAGFSKVCINPPYGSPIVGYYEERLVKGIHDDLFVRATAFDDGEKKAFIIAIDVCYLQQYHFDNCKKAIKDATGVNEDAIFINCSHTHTGPLLGVDFASEKSSTEEYDKFIVDSVRDAAVYALSDLDEATVETASSVAKNISFIRRYRMKDGSVQTNPGVNNPNIDYPLGTPNETIKVIKIKRKNSDDIVMLNFGTHSDSVGGDYISGDYMNYACDIMERAVPGTKCMFLLGCQGDVNHVNTNPTKGEAAISVIDFDGVPRSNAHAEHMGRIIAGAALSVYSITEEVKADKISYASSKVELPSHQENDRLEEAKHIHDFYANGRADELPYKEMELTTVVAEAERILRLQNGPQSFDFYISAVKIGDLVFAGIGGEPFTEIGTRICAGSPFKETVLCCLTNTAGGYIPTRTAYEEGGYEAKSSSLKPGGDDILVNGTIELLNKIK
ncbi:MAG: hypothetical protein E7407_04115 [Ruminococcaceae bacterium]|nr:hypothetical protein [Oscillospiraceae bacterium]